VRPSAGSTRLDPAPLAEPGVWIERTRDHWTARLDDQRALAGGSGPSCCSVATSPRSSNFREVLDRAAARVIR
jgi:hypothetical protein